MGFANILTGELYAGWWYTYPSEKYKFISWDYEIPHVLVYIYIYGKICSKPPTSPCWMIHQGMVKLPAIQKHSTSFNFDISGVAKTCFREIGKRFLWSSPAAMSGHLMATSVASMPQCAKAFSFGEYLGFSLAYYILIYIVIYIYMYT